VTRKSRYRKDDRAIRVPYLNVTDGQTDGRYTVASPRGKT